MNVIVDTGPIVALLNKKDRYHGFVDEQMHSLQAPFYTCEAVITESFFLLQRVAHGTERLIELLDTEKIDFFFDYPKHKSRVHQIIQDYNKLPASFADAFLVSMFDTTPNASIFTLDSDFNIYRNFTGNTIPLISPF